MTNWTVKEVDGERSRDWYSRTLHLKVDTSLDELIACGYGPWYGVGTITLHLNDGCEIDIGSSQEHSLSYRDGAAKDIRKPEEDDE